MIGVDVDVDRERKEGINSQRAGALLIQQGKKEEKIRPQKEGKMSMQQQQDKVLN